MTTVSQIIAEQANANINKSTWGSIVVNVKAFGAQGDGVKDDTAAIQKAVDYAKTIGKHEIVFPAGSYVYGALKNMDGITFVGDGVTLNGIPSMTYASRNSSLINMYVNGTTGNNNNDGSASDRALKTIQAAVEKRPTILGGEIFIHVAPGTYNEYVIINVHLGQAITIVGASAAAGAGAYKVQGFWCYRCMDIVIKGFELIGGNNVPPGYPLIFAENVVYMEAQENISTVNTRATFNDGIRAAHGSAVYCKNNLMSNKLAGLSVASGGRLISTDSSGTGNLYGLFAQEGHLFKHSSQPTGDTPEFTAYGGVIS